MPAGLDWYLHRKNCASCAKSEAWLTARGLEPREQVDARKHRFDEAATWELVADCDRISVARGKSWLHFDPRDAGQRAEMGSKMFGPHGTLRAPAMRFGRHFVVGFHEEMLEQARAMAQGQGA